MGHQEGHFETQQEERQVMNPTTSPSVPGTPEAAREAIASIIATEQPLSNVVPSMLPCGDLGQLIRKIRRENQRELHALQAKENYKPCRKKCRLFKCEQCWKKSFEEQKKCWDGNLYLTVPQPRKPMMK